MTTGKSEAATHDYWVFGLRVRSRLELPELIPATADFQPDLFVDEGPVTQRPDVNQGLVPAGDALLLVIPDVARFLVRNGNHITVDPVPLAPARNVRLFLLGSAMGALLHQRGLLPLHANAIEIGGQAVAFMGPSGEGKSTLAAWFHDKGHQVIADDVCVVSADGSDGPTVRPGLPRLRLWREALEASGRNAGDYPASYVDDGNYDKFDVPLARQSEPEKAWPLACVYLLDRAETFAISRLEGVSAAEALIANTYRGQFTQAARNVVPHWSACMAVARATPIFRVTRQWGRERFDSQVGALLDHAGALIERA